MAEIKGFYGIILHTREVYKDITSLIFIFPVFCGYTLSFCPIFYSSGLFSAVNSVKGTGCTGGGAVSQGLVRLSSRLVTGKISFEGGLNHGL